MAQTQSKLILGILLLIVTIAVAFALFVDSIIFGFLNQSSLAPKVEQLTVWNHLIPFLITVGFLLWIPIRMLRNSKAGKQRLPRWVSFLLVLVGAAVALKWQFLQVVWPFVAESSIAQMWPVYLLAAFFTIWALGMKALEMRRKT